MHIITPKHSKDEGAYAVVNEYGEKVVFFFVEKDDAEAVAWYRKAADCGNSIAQNNLGKMHFEGRGVEQSSADAEARFLKAAELP